MIFTIGHGNKKIEDFVKELNSFNILYVIDVRSNPYSKFNPQYNRESFKNVLLKSNLKYVFMGDSLGGLPYDKTCFVDGKVDYDIIKDRPFFKEGIQRLIMANKKEINIAIMCSESKPEECHRSKLIGQELLRCNILVSHIISLRKIRSQSEVMLQITKGKNIIDLFGEETTFTSRKKYI